MKRQIPNILTIGRLGLTLVMFGALAALLWTPYETPRAANLAILAAVLFIIAAVTDFFDGYLARKWNVVSTTGAILDPIGDKVLVCGALLGLLALGFREALIPSGLILFREFSVSALREVLAPKGLKLPVTFLAKTKTTLQLIALAAYLSLLAWDVAPGESAQPLFDQLMLGAQGGLWLAALVTVWTGIEYALSARRALSS